MADQYVRRIAHALLDNGGANSVQYLYAPVLDGTGGAGTGVQITTGAGAWGAYKDLANGGGTAIATEFWVCGLSAHTASGAQVFQIQLYNLTLTRVLANFEYNPTAVTINMKPLMVQYPIYCAPNSNVQIRGGGAAAKTLQTWLVYAVNL